MTTECKFQVGEEIKVKKGHPFAGRRGIVITTLSATSFFVILSATRQKEQQRIPIFDDAMDRLPAAQQRHLQAVGA